MIFWNDPYDRPAASGYPHDHDGHLAPLRARSRSAERACEKSNDKISRYAERLVATGEEIEREFGIPIVNKRVSVTPSRWSPPRRRRKTMSRLPRRLTARAKNVGVNFIGGFSALVQKGMTDADRKLIAAIPEALACTDLVCSSVNVGSSKAGINMDAVALMGQTVKRRRAHGKTGRLWLRQACNLLQCGRG